jgi:sigma-B regulation protein RsbU (phosphoserine phosphatase)
MQLPLRHALALMILLPAFAVGVLLTVVFWVRADDAALALAHDYLRLLNERIGERLVQDAGATEPAAFLQSSMAGRRGIAYLLDGDGRLIGASSGDAVIDRHGGALPLPAAGIPAARSSNRWIAVSAARMAWPGDGNWQPDRIPARLSIDGDALLLAAQRIEPAGAGRQLLVTLAPVDTALPGVTRRRIEVLAIAFGALLIAAAAAWLLTGLVMRPLGQLSDYLRRVGQGRLQDDLLLTDFPEFMRLSFALNSLVEGLRERVKLRQSLAMAMEVQQRLLPSEVPDCPGLDIAGRSYYCDQTGGDYYDYLRIDRLPGTTAVIAIGDVSGHGVASAMVMAAARVVLRNRCREAQSLAELLTQVNAQVAQDSGRGRYMTLLLTAVDAQRGELRWASAGHREPLLLDPGADSFRALQGAGIPLGVAESADYEEYHGDAPRPGQVLLLATDGLWEAANTGGEAYGLERLCAVMRANAQGSANEICGAIALDVIAYCGRRAQDDDISFVVVKVVDTGSAA